VNPAKKKRKNILRKIFDLYVAFWSGVEHRRGKNLPNSRHTFLCTSKVITSFLHLSSPLSLPLSPFFSFSAILENSSPLIMKETTTPQNHLGRLRIVSEEIENGGTKDKKEES